MTVGSFFKGAAHDISVAAKAVKAAILKGVGEVDVIAPKIAATAPEVEALAELAIPGSGAIVAAGENLVELVAEEIDKAGEAAGANGLSVTLDQDVINTFKNTIIPALKAFKAKNPAPTPAS